MKNTLQDLHERMDTVSKRNKGILNEVDDEFAEIEKLGRDVAGKCHWDGHAITRVYLEALTDANFHSERKKIAPMLSKILGTDFSPV